MNGPKRRRRFLRRKKGRSEEVVLQITSMADIMTILLVFLLKSFSSGAADITPGADVLLPQAVAGDSVPDALKLQVSPTAVLLDEKAVTRLTGFAFQQGDVENDGTPRSLNTALVELRQREKGREPSSARTRGLPLLVLADERTPYATLKSIMQAAANQGFGDFKLVVVEDR